MKILNSIFFVIFIAIANISCTNQKEEVFQPKEVYKSNDLTIIQITENSFVHTSFKQTRDFGNVPCNGLVVKNDNEVIVFDTPTNNKSSEILIKWVSEVLHCKVNAIIPTHFHDDCLGGLQVFHEKNIPSYANFKTVELAKENNFVVPQNGFNDSLVLKLGTEQVIAKFLGEGHTKDNIIGYFPGEKVMFGGCLIKELDASKGYLGDANVEAWSGTVARVKKEYPDVKIVVPGHGEYGNIKLLDYTIKLFNTQ